MKRIVLFISLILLFLGADSFASFNTPPLRIRQFQDLKFPPQLHRGKVVEILQASATELYRHSYVDFGAMSDFMHLHALFRPINKNISTPETALTEIELNYDWSQVNLIAALAHTQEYSHLRPSKSYEFEGKTLDPFRRNWILWLSSYLMPEWTWVRAHEFYTREYKELPRTVRAAELNPDVFGEAPEDWEYSFYFFRVACTEQERINPAKLSSSTLVEIFLGDEKLCLNLVNFHCRYYPGDKENCGHEPDVASFY